MSEHGPWHPCDGRAPASLAASRHDQLRHTRGERLSRTSGGDSRRNPRRRVLKWQTLISMGGQCGIPMPHPRYTKEQIAERGKEIYDQQIRSHVETIHTGKYLVINIETGEYEI